MPLAKSGRFYFCCSKLVTLLVIVVEPKVIFESVSSDNVVPSVREAKDDPTRSIFLARDGPEANSDVNVSIRTSGRQNHFELILHGALDQHLFTARRAGQLFYRPLAIDDFPPFNALLFEIEPLDTRII